MVVAYGPDKTVKTDDSASGPVRSTPDVQIGSRRQAVRHADPRQGLVGQRRDTEPASAQQVIGSSRSRNGPIRASALTRPRYVAATAAGRLRQNASPPEYTVRSGPAPPCTLWRQLFDAARLRKTAGGANEQFTGALSSEGGVPGWFPPLAALAP